MALDPVLQAHRPELRDRATGNSDGELLASLGPSEHVTHVVAELLLWDRGSSPLGSSSSYRTHPQPNPKRAGDPGECISSLRLTGELVTIDNRLANSARRHENSASPAS